MEEKANMKKLFIIFDEDESNQVSIDELANGFRKLGKKAETAELSKVLVQLDHSKGSRADGELDFKEFQNGVLNRDSQLFWLLYEKEAAAESEGGGGHARFDDTANGTSRSSGSGKMGLVEKAKRFSMHQKARASVLKDSGIDEGMDSLKDEAVSESNRGNESGSNGQQQPTSPTSSTSFAAAAALAIKGHQPQQVFKCGWVDKLGGAKGGRKTWKKRYFELVVEAHTAVLVYFKDHHRESKKGEIDLAGCNCSMLNEFSDNGKGVGSFRKVGGGGKSVPKEKQACAFVLTHPSRREANRVFKVDTPAGASEWVFMLRRATIQINTVTPGPSPSIELASVSSGRRLSSRGLVSDDGCDTTVEEEEEVEVEGMLHVKAQGEGALKRRNWRRCHCALNGNTLVVRESGPTGKVWKQHQLTWGASCAVVQSQKHEHTFQISAQSSPPDVDVPMNLFAESAAEKERWIVALRLCIERLERFTA
jgi:hypothetical protein